MSKRKQSSPRSSGEKPYQVSLSHATADQWPAKVLCDKIEAAGAAAEAEEAGPPPFGRPSEFLIHDDRT